MNQVFNSNLPKEEKTETRLFQEIAIVIGAGTETTANAVVRTIYHLLPLRDGAIRDQARGCGYGS